MFVRGEAGPNREVKVKSVVHGCMHVVYGCMHASNMQRHTHEQQDCGNEALVYACPLCFPYRTPSLLPRFFLFDQKPGTVTVLHGILQGFLRLHTSRSLIRICAKDHLPGLIHVGLDLGNVRGHRAVRS